LNPGETAKEGEKNVEGVVAKFGKKTAEDEPLGKVAWYVKTLRCIHQMSNWGKHHGKGKKRGNKLKQLALGRIRKPREKEHNSASPKAKKKAVPRGGGKKGPGSARLRAQAHKLGLAELKKEDHGQKAQTTRRKSKEEAYKRADVGVGTSYGSKERERAARGGTKARGKTLMTLSRSGRDGSY